MKVNPYDQILIASSDDNLSEKAKQTVPISEVDLHVLIQKFKENKISAERLEPFVTGMGAQEDRQYLANQIAHDKMFRDRWTEFLKFALKLLYGGNVHPVLIKFLRYPFAKMSDVDLLILDPEQELEVVELLSKAGFAFLQFRLLAHPLGLTARESSMSNAGYGEINLDLYPEPIWNRKKVCDSVVIFSRRTTLDKDDLRLFVPSSEDDLYLVGTHAHAHLTLTLAEILHGLEVIANSKNFDWKYLYNVAQNYGCLDSIYLYLKALDVYSRTFYGWSSFDEVIFDVYEENKVCREVGSWFTKSHSNSIKFPIRIPVGIGCVRSSFYHGGVLLGHMSFSDSLNDFLSHYLALSAELILGTT